MRRKALGLSGTVGLLMFMAVLFLPARSSQAAVEFGGFDNYAYAAPVSMLLYEPFIPVPTSPQGELHYSYSEATLQSGPFAQSTASTVYPGATLATGLPQFNSHLPNYPVQTNATYPGTKDETSTKKSFGPGMMSASDSATKSTATAQTGGSSAGSTISFTQASSTATDTVQSGKVTADAVADVQNLGLMGSIIGIQNVHGELHAESDGKKGSVSGKEVVTGLTVAGQGFKLDDKGLHFGPINLPLPGAPKNGQDLLNQLGISFSQPAIQSRVDGTHGLITGSSLLISIDTKTFHDALNKLPIRALIALTPNPCVQQLDQSPTGPCLHDQFDAILSLSPRIVFLLTNTYTSSNGVPQFVVPPFSGGSDFPPTTTTTAGTPGTPGTPGTSGTPGLTTDNGAGSLAPQVAGGGAQTVSSETPAGYKGLKTAALLGALAALGTWYAIRNLGLVVVGGLAGCEYGAPRTVPDLRRG